MKLRVFLFLALFFSSFLVFAGTKADAMASCKAYSIDWPECIDDSVNHRVNACRHPYKDHPDYIQCGMWWPYDACPDGQHYGVKGFQCYPNCKSGAEETTSSAALIDFLTASVNKTPGSICSNSLCELSFNYSENREYNNGIPYIYVHLVQTGASCSEDVFVDYQELFDYSCTNPAFYFDPETTRCKPQARCDFPLRNNPANRDECITYDLCPDGQERDKNEPHDCKPCQKPEIWNSEHKRCEMPNCPPPGAWNYTTNKCEGSPPLKECQPGYHRDMYGNCVPDADPNPPSNQQPPPGQPGHDGHGSGTSTSSDGTTSKFDFNIDLSGIEGMLGEVSKTATNIDKTTTNIDKTATNIDKTATNIDKTTTNIDKNTKGILDKLSEFFDKKATDGQHSTDDLDTSYNSAATAFMGDVSSKLSSNNSDLNGYTPDSSNFDSVKNIFPTSSQCSGDYSLPITLKKYSFTVVLPVCKFVIFKVIIEWVIYALTALYVFNVSLDISMTKG